MPPSHNSSEAFSVFLSFFISSHHSAVPTSLSSGGFSSGMSSDVQLDDPTRLAQENGHEC